MLKRLLIFVTLLVIASVPLRAQVIVDVAKIDCHQFATYKIAHPDRIAIWLDGYFHGKRGDPDCGPSGARRRCR
jgi:acid stress chaperone HdeB